MTDNYTNTESQIKPLETEEKALLGILAKCETVQDTMSVQERLASVRGELESLRAQKKNYDQRIAYSEILISISEVERVKKTPTGFGSQVKENFFESIYNIGQFFRSLGIFILGESPYIVLIAAVAALVILIVKKKRKKNKKAQTEETKEQQETVNMEELQDFQTLVGNYYTVDADYAFKIKNFETETVGVHFGHILNRNPYFLNGVEQLSRRNDTWVAAYFKGEKKFKNGLAILFGLRYEYNNSVLNGGKENEIRNHSSFFIPNVRLKYRKNGNSYQLQYSRSASNPLIYQLNPVVEYIDSLHYSTGNPSLRSYYGNKFAFSTNIGNLSLSTSYTWGHNAPVQANILEKGNIIKYMPISSDLYTCFDFNADYSIDSNDGRFSSSYSAGVEYVTTKYTANESASTNRQTSFYGEINLSWSFLKNWRIFGEAFYQSPRINGGLRYGYQLSSKIGISAQLLNKRLRISLQGKDFFNRSVAPTETEFTYLNVYEKVRNRYDTRGVSLTLSYAFNGFWSKYRRAFSDFTTSYRTTRK